MMYRKLSILLLLLSGITYWYFSKSNQATEEQYNNEIKDRVVLLCGASSGIGENMAYQLAAKQAKLVLVARTVSKLQKVKENALKLGSPQVEIISYDFSDVENSKTVVDKSVEMFGKLDYLVLNHASMTHGMFLEFQKHQQPGFIERMFRINLFSYIQLTLQALPHLEKAGGHIFVTSSIAGEIPTMGAALYSSTKHAMNGFFYSLQQELLAKDSDITVTIGALGLILTDELTYLLGEEKVKEIPGFFIGNVTTCASEMVDTLILRPRTFTYPAVSNNLFRMLWYFYPSYNEMAVNQEPGVTYEDKVERAKLMHKKADVVGYQRGSF